MPSAVRGQRAASAEIGGIKIECTSVGVRATVEREFARANQTVTPQRRHSIQAGRCQPKCRTMRVLDRRRKRLINSFSILHSLKFATRSKRIRGELAESLSRVRSSIVL